MMDAFKRGLSRKPRDAWWARGINDEQQPWVIGPSDDEEAAIESAADLSQVKTYHLPTRDRSSATQMIKARQLHDNGSAEGLRRVRHQGGNGSGPSSGGGKDDDDDSGGESKPFRMWQ